MSIETKEDCFRLWLRPLALVLSSLALAINVGWAQVGCSPTAFVRDGLCQPASNCLQLTIRKRM
jgi:hypothetical protein